MTDFGDPMMLIRHRALFATFVLCPLLLVLAACQECEVPATHDAPATDHGTVADSPASTASTLPVLAGLDKGWNVLKPAGETTCSDGSPYHFYARPGDPERVLFYLQGGGACWNGATCDPDGDPSYRIDLSDFDPKQRHGIFAFDQAENPFADYTVVLAPYCTGDVHLGDNEVTYEAPATEGHEAHPVTVRFRGLDNGQAVLDWVHQNLPDVKDLFVTGSSAGSIPSPYYAMLLAEAYPEARIVQLGDGSGGYRDFGEEPPQVQWGTLPALSKIPEFAQMTPEQLDFEALFAVAEAHQPNITYAQYDTAEDDVQKRFLKLANVEAASLLELLRANQADIRTQVPGFRSYIAGGELHTILLRPEFYSYHVDGVRVVDWVADLAIGEPVEDVHCVDCAEAEILPSPSAP